MFGALRGVILICSLFVTGCASYVVPEPGRITLEDALESVGRGLVRMKAAQIKENGDRPFSAGLAAAEVDVTFNISASGKDEGRIYVELTPVPTSPVPTGGKVGAEGSTQLITSRGNQITVRFRSILFRKVVQKDGTTIYEVDEKLRDRLLRGDANMDGSPVIFDKRLQRR